MNTRSSNLWLLILFVACVLASGLSLWTLPYAKLNLPNALFGVGLWVVAIAAFAARLAGMARSWRIMVLLGLGPVAALVARIIVDTSRDPTAHNLWPLEIAITLPIALICAGLGALAGWLLTLFLSKRAVLENRQ